MAEIITFPRDRVSEKAFEGGAKILLLPTKRTMQFFVFSPLAFALQCADMWN